MVKNLALCVLIAWITQGTPFEIPNELLEDDVNQRCMKELSLGSTQLSSIFDEQFLVIRPLSQTATEFYECNLRKFQFLKEDGELNKELITEKLAKIIPILAKTAIDIDKAHDLSQKLYNRCNTPKGSNPVEKLADFHDCIIIQLPKLVPQVYSMAYVN
ncbi:uncharacterized protein LOC116178161 [Photinus pyralis]|uniref:Uncharacterized protein n=1 Tax=Photinus pyralis TaxID=7054 RepID=A0A1Y1MUU3_PHOPY|nr:uncharacterized protein LOC116178161 [Photinus pyralis]